MSVPCHTGGVCRHRTDSWAGSTSGSGRPTLRPTLSSLSSSESYLYPIPQFSSVWLTSRSTKGTIPPEAQIAEMKKKEREAEEAQEGDKNLEKREVRDLVDSDDEELDQRALQNGDLEG